MFVKSPVVTPPSAPAPDPMSGFTATMAPDFTVRLVDDTNGTVLMSSNKQAVWAPTPGGTNPSLTPAIDFRPQTGGFDVVYTFNNTTSSPMSPGLVYAPGIRFGQTILSRNFNRDFKVQTLDNQGSMYFAGGDTYPYGQYSPVNVISNDKYTIGVSINYSVPAYNHAVYLRAESPGGQYTFGGRNWQILMALNPPANRSDTVSYNPAGDIQPGETRVYTMCVRATRSSLADPGSDWMRTLTPYRAFFNSTYGGMHYVRDARPVRGMTTTDVHTVSSDNPFGFDSGFRPDINGWNGYVTRMQSERSKGWTRWMVWTPTGVYGNHTEFNYPPQFTSHWQSIGPMRDSLSALSNFGQSNQLGLWWGRSTQVANGWDTGDVHWLDTSNPSDVNFSFHELDGATAVKATAVGLDNFTQYEMGAWNCYRWLQRLQAHAPSVKFVVEPRCADFIHSLSPTIVYGTRPNSQAISRVNAPFYMADFLMPGHETWALIDVAELREELNLSAADPLPDATIAAKVKQIADWGYVPVLLSGNQPPAGLHAADSWLASVPTDLQSGQ